ncbi:MAG TPA: hypothetical protein DCM28_08420 [Phycisphaerales bacterium]|nr:hypothetical protein [Phycisphaerales bacterium]|tara:strand:+ start:218 stop:730 length:513 start_codon:yes stop_codon:yes gene_type:complete
MIHFIRYGGTIFLALLFYIQFHDWIYLLFIPFRCSFIYGSMGIFLAEFNKLILVVIASGGLIAHFSGRISCSLKVHYLFALVFCIGFQTILILVVSGFHRVLLFSWDDGFLVSNIYKVDASNGGIRLNCSPINISLILVQTLFYITLRLVLGRKNASGKEAEKGCSELIQ